MEQKLVEYFFLFKGLSRLHKDFGFGETPRSSEGFTESLCCHLFDNLQRINGVRRKHDLENKKTFEKIEVKGTTNATGRTTINPSSEFHYLYWVIILQRENKVLIKKIKRESMSSFFTRYFNTKKRTPISLSKFEATEVTEHLFDENMKTIKSYRIK